MNDNDPFSGWPSYLLQLAFIFVKMKMAVISRHCMLTVHVFLWITMSSVSSLKCYQPNTTEDGFLSVFSSLVGSLAPTSSVLADCPENTNCIISGDETDWPSPLLSLIIMQVLFSPGNSSVYIQMCGFGPSTFTGCIDNVENGFKYKFCSCDTDGLVEDDLYTWCSPFISLFFSCNRNLEALQSSAERTTYNWRVIVPLIIIQQTVFEYK